MWVSVATGGNPLARVFPALWPGNDPEAGVTETSDGGPVTQKDQVADAGPLAAPLFPTTYQ